MFWSLSHHLLETEEEKNDGTKSTKKQREREKFEYKYIQTGGKTERDADLNGKCFRAGGSWLSKTADYKNSHHIAYPLLHTCSVSAIPVSGSLSN